MSIVLRPKKKPVDDYLAKVQKQASSTTSTIKKLNTPATTTAPQGSGLSSVTSKNKQALGSNYTRQNISSVNLNKGASLGTQAEVPMLVAPRIKPLELQNASSGHMRRLNEINRIGEIESAGVFERYQREQQRREEEARQAALANQGNPFDKYNLEGVSARTYPQGSFGGSGSSGGSTLNRSMLKNLSADQIKNAETIIGIGRKRGVSDQDIEIALMTALAESNLINVNYGDRDSLGLFQQRPSQGWGTPAQVSNPIYSTNKFYDALSKTRRGRNPWNTAQNVQRSAFADGSNYRAHAGTARQIMQSIQVARNAPATTSGKANIAGWVNSNVWKYHDFDGAYGSQCVDLFRYYHRDVVGDKQIGSVGGAKNIWTNQEMNRAYNRISRTSRAQQGDVVVFDGSLGSGYGHVGIVLEDKGGTLKIINSNSSTVGNGKPTNIVTLSKKGLLGYWRPKKFS